MVYLGAHTGTDRLKKTHTPRLRHAMPMFAVFQNSSIFVQEVLTMYTPNNLLIGY